MLVLDHPGPLHAAVTGHTRRRTWGHPELVSHSLLLLSADRLCLSPAEPSPDPDIRAAAEAGARTDELIGPGATVIDLAAISRVAISLPTNTVSIESKFGRVPVVFADAEPADAFFSTLWELLGRRFALSPYRRSWWGLARAPVVLLGAVLAITTALALTIAFLDEMSAGRAAASVNLPGGDELAGGQSPLEKLLGWMDWRVVCGLGGAVAAATQVWLYRRLTNPPTALEVVRT